jgi:hypothetical protein
MDAMVAEVRVERLGTFPRYWWCQSCRVEIGSVHSTDSRSGELIIKSDTVIYTDLAYLVRVSGSIAPYQAMVIHRALLTPSFDPHLLRLTNRLFA